jgi:hypothetical protein
MWHPTQRVSAEANLFDYAEPQGERRSQSRKPAFHSVFYPQSLRFVGMIHIKLLQSFQPHFHLIFLTKQPQKPMNYLIILSVCIFSFIYIQYLTKHNIIISFVCPNLSFVMGVSIDMNVLRTFEFPRQGIHINRKCDVSPKPYCP